MLLTVTTLFAIRREIGAFLEAHNGMTPPASIPVRATFYSVIAPLHITPLKRVRKQGPKLIPSV